MPANYDLNPTLANYGTNRVRQPWNGGHEGCRLEIVTHTLYAEGVDVDWIDRERGAVHAPGESSWEEVKDTLVRYLHCKDHDLEWDIGKLPTERPSLTMRSYPNNGEQRSNWPWITVIHPTEFPDAIIERDSCPGYAQWRGPWWAEKLGADLIIDRSFQNAIDWWEGQKVRK